MNYKRHSDEELRRVLLTDPYDPVAICEASDRFAKQVGNQEVEFPFDCPHCGEEIESEEA